MTNLNAVMVSKYLYHTQSTGVEKLGLSKILPKYSVHDEVIAIKCSAFMRINLYRK